MLPLPAPRVFAKGAIEFRAAHDGFAQDRKHECRLLVRGPVQLPYLVGFGDHRLLAARDRGGGVRAEELAPHRITVRRALEERLGGVVIGECIEAFVHPRIAPLIRPDLHRKPLMAELVHEHPVLVFALLQRGTIDHHRVLHPLDQPLHRRDLRPRILAQRARKMSEGEPQHGVRFFPRRGVGMIERLDQDPVPRARVPAQARSRGPGEIADAARGEAPRSCARDRTRGARDGFLPRDDLHDLSRRRKCARQPSALLRRANRRRVGERACRRDLESGGDRETDVEIAEFEIELARAQEGQCVPAMHVVVHGHARVPLAELVEA